MSNKKYLAWFFSDTSLDVTLSSHLFTIEKFSENFEKFYMINLLCIKSLKSKQEFSYKINDKFKLPQNVKIFSPKTINELKKFLIEKEIIGICNFGKHFVDFKYHLFLNFYKVKLIQISNVGNVQWTIKCPKNTLWTEIKFRLEKFYSHKIIILLSNLKIVPKIEIRFITDSSILKNINKNFLKKFLYKAKLFYAKELLLINSRTYDKSKLYRGEISENEIVLLDYQLDHSVDIDTGYIYEEKKAEEHYFRLNKLLFKLSELYKKQVVVTVHPDDNLELKKKLFPKFKVVQHETLDHIRKSYMVLFFDSTAITDAIFLEKRIVAICSPFTHSVPRDGSKEFSARAGIFLMDLDKELSINKEKLLSNLENHKKGYSDYIKKYIASDGDELGYQKIIETIKNKFF